MESGPKGEDLGGKTWSTRWPGLDVANGRKKVSVPYGLGVG